MLRGDKTKDFKIEQAKLSIINSLNEVKSVLQSKDFTFHKTSIKDLISSPNSNSFKHNKEDEVIKS